MINTDDGHTVERARLGSDASAVATILVVDDDPGIRHLLVTVLHEEGYQTREARNGADGLDVLATAAPQLVLVDLMMPVTDGVYFLNRCRAVPGCADVPVVVVSAALAPEVVGLYDNVRAVIHKPFDLAALTNAVNRFVQPSPSGA